MMKSTRRALLRASLAVSVLAMSHGAATAEGLMDRAKGDGLRVAFYNFKPYAYKDGKDELTGTDVETLRTVLNQMGGKIDTAQSTDWGALIPGIKAGRFDVVAAGMFVTPKRCLEVKFSEPTFGIQQSLVVMRDNPEGVVDYNTIAEKGLTVAAISGSAQVGYAKKSGVNDAKIMQVPDVPTAVAALRAGRAQIFAVSVPGSRDVVATVPEQDLEMVPSFSQVAGELAMPHGAFAFRKDDAAFVDEFNARLADFIGSPEHVAILEKHGMKADELPKLSTSELCEG